MRLRKQDKQSCISCREAILFITPLGKQAHIACCGFAILILLLGLAFGYASRRSDQSGFASLALSVACLPSGVISCSAELVIWPQKLIASR